ncbi:hypothetical protein CTV96_09465 [Bacillus altitudinis]|uniref:hypothetical protein n=1 Tax=Bacillus altitudinis TaxID=293387 RepID=UPI000C23A5D8|nr:hypothetical protein [Bacillus altitudinis]PJI12366.1 hypothetical protein CTV96_09465 [Bacillus altitudinis]PKQ85620.1 hypothetical protein CTV98_007630 [Bacillus altitudinis]
MSGLSLTEIQYLRDLLVADSLANGDGAAKLAIFDKLDALEFADHEPVYKTGDLVSVEGYKGRVFYIDCAKYIEETTKEAVFNYIEYDLYDAINGEWLEAFESDMRLIADAVVAEDFLADFNLEDYPPARSTVYLINYETEAANMAEKEQPITSRVQKRKQERKDAANQTDNLLDIYNWNKAQYEKTGELSFKAKMDDVMAQLAGEGAERR